MPVPNPFEFCQLESADRHKFIVELGTDTTWVAWWYCDALRAWASEKDVNLRVAFRQLLPNNSFSDFDWKEIPIAELGNVKLGSAWRNGFLVGQTILEARMIHVEFRPGKWWLTSFEHAKSEEDPPPFFRDEYPAYHMDDNGLLIFEDKGVKYIIPCAEFFLAWYGRDAEIRSSLLSLPMTEFLSNYLGRTTPDISEGKWRITTKEPQYHDDLIFIAHLVHDEDAKVAAGSLYKTRIDQKGRNEKTYIHARPWFSGEAEMMVEGIPINNGRDFLVLRITSRSNPIGPEITVVSEKAYSDPDSSGSGQIEDRKQINVSMPPTEVEHISDDTPSKDGSKIKRYSSGVTIIGEKRKVRVFHPNKIRVQGKPYYTEVTAEQFSSYAPSGSEGNIGELRIATGYSAQSMGPHWDLWRGLNLLNYLFPKSISAPQGYSPKGGYNSKFPPTFCLIGDQFSSSSEVTRLPKWLEIKVPSPDLIGQMVLRGRGILIVRVFIEGRAIHFLEIERTPIVSQANPNGKAHEFDHFSGLIFELNNTSSILSALKTLRFHIATQRGVFRNNLPYEFGTFHAFEHHAAAGEVVPGMQTILRAFRKMGIEFPRIDSAPPENWHRGRFQ